MLGLFLGACAVKLQERVFVLSNMQILGVFNSQLRGGVGAKDLPRRSLFALKVELLMV